MNKPTISSFTYCDKVQQTLTPNGTEKQILNPLQDLTPISIPGNYTFCIACIISGIKYDLSNHLKITFEDPKGDILETLEQQNCNPPEETLDRERLYSMQIDIEFRNTILNQTGTYGTRIIFNGTELGLFTINVIQAKTKNEKESL